jgi:hypothetical protein
MVGTQAFIGSSNVSQYSANTLIEAMLHTTDRQTVSAVRKFVRDLCVQELGPAELERLAKLYRPPHVAGKRLLEPPITKSPPVFLAQLVREDPPTESDKASNAGQKIALSLQKKPKKHTVEWIWMPDECPYQPGDIVVKVMDEGKGKEMVSAPGTFLNAKKWRRGTSALTFVYLELPRRKRKSLKKLASSIGGSAVKQLKKDGKASRDFADRLLAAWKQ